LVIALRDRKTGLGLFFVAMGAWHFWALFVYRSLGEYGYIWMGLSSLLMAGVAALSYRKLVPGVSRVLALLLFLPNLVLAFTFFSDYFNIRVMGLSDEITGASAGVMVALIGAYFLVRGVRR
jgi:hypothetical protein